MYSVNSTFCNIAYELHEFQYNLDIYTVHDAGHYTLDLNTNMVMITTTLAFAKKTLSLAIFTADMKKHLRQDFNVEVCGWE